MMADDGYKAFKASLMQQESGRNYQAKNTRTGALGGYQVMPQNLDGSWGGRAPKSNFGWDFDALGRDVSPQEFLSNPTLQEKIVEHQLRQAYAKHGPQGAARWWYSNSPNASSKQPKPNEPSPNQYSAQVLSRMDRQGGSGGGGGGPTTEGRDLSAVLFAARTPRQAVDPAGGRDLSAVLFANEQKPKKPSVAKSALLGFADGLGATIVQGVAKAGDVVNKYMINPALGTNLEEDAYGKYTRSYDLARREHEAARDANDAGFDFARLGGNITGGLPLGLMAKGFGGAKVLSTQGAKVLAQNAAVGAGIGGAQFANNTGERIDNAASGAIGGALGAVAAEKVIAPAARGAISAVARRLPSTREGIRAEAASQVQMAFEQRGMNFAALNQDMRKRLTDEVAAAMRVGKAVTPESIVRKAGIEKVGLSGTNAQVSGRAQDWQSEVAMSKLKDVGDPLRDKYIGDSTNLTGLMDDAAKATGGNAPDNYGAMESVFGALRGNDATRQKVVGDLYDAARNATGNDLQLNAARFVNNVSNDLETQGLGTFLKTDVRGILGGLFKGQGQLTLAKKEELVKVLNARLKNSTDGSQRQALKIVRDRLEQEVSQTLDDFDQVIVPQGRQNTGVGGQGRLIGRDASTDLSTNVMGRGLSNDVLPPVDDVGQGADDAIAAWKAAREAASKRFGNIQRTPAIQAALDDVAPDQAFEKLVLRGNARDLDALATELQNNPAAFNAVRQRVVEHIASQATQASNKQFSPAAMKKALNAIGDRRLSALFSPKEIAHLRDIHAAADYLITQPRHSAINNSNSGSDIANFMMRGLNSAASIPGIGGVTKMAANFAQRAAAHGKVSTSMTGDLATNPITGLPMSGAEREMLQRYGMAIDGAGKLVKISSASATSGNQ